MTVVFVPPTRFVPAADESETNDGAFASRLAVQFNGAPPVFEIVNDSGVLLSPFERLKASVPGLTARTGGTSVTVNITPTVCGLPLMAVLPLSAVSAIVPV